MVLAPVLYIQPDEEFRLERVVAVIHPDRAVIAYHLLWRDDAHGAWIPFTSPTDQEIVWVGHDSAGRPTEMWTYWHGSILHTDWRGKGEPAVDVQWGKHGSLPHNVVLGDLPWIRQLDVYYLLSWVLLPDLWLGNLSRDGPWCFCASFARYNSFTRVVPVAMRLDAIVETAAPESILRRVFGEGFSGKPAWPWRH